MQKLSKFLVVVVAVMMFGCGDDEKENDEPIDPTLVVTPNSEVTFAADGTSADVVTFTVNTNQTSWDAKSDKAWLTVSKAATGFSLSATPNTEPTAPEAAKVTVTAGTATAVIINATQAAAEIPEVGVEINGIVWATRNLAEIGHFAPFPESTGMYYQWNRAKAWNGSYYAGWDKTIPTPEINVWDETVNNISPEGWRLPTRDECLKLLETDKVSNVWTTLNNVYGRLFTDLTTNKTLFLRGAGFLEETNGSVSMAADPIILGFYWSSDSQKTPYAYYLNINKDGAGAIVGSSPLTRATGMSIRLVKANAE